MAIIGNMTYKEKYKLASNPSTPLGVLRELAKDEFGLFGGGVAKHPKSDISILISILEYEKTLKKPDKDVIKSLYANLLMPLFAKRVIETLWGDKL